MSNSKHKIFMICAIAIFTLWFALNAITIMIIKDANRKIGSIIERTER